MKIQVEKQFRPDNDNVRGIISGYGLDFLSYSEFELGVENISLKVLTKQGLCVLRIIRTGKKSDRDLMRELRFMEYLYEHEVPVPKIFKTKKGGYMYKYKEDTGRVFQSVLMDFMVGKHIKKYSKEQLMSLAREVVSLQNLGEKFARKNKMRAKKKYVYSLSRPTVKLHDSRLEDFFNRVKHLKVELVNSKHIGFYHVDLDARNILFSGVKLAAFLDFDDARLATTVHDLAALVGDIISVNKNTSDADFFLSEYQRYKNIGDDFMKIKKIVHIFHCWYVKFIIETKGEASKEIAKLIKVEKLLQDWQ